MVLIVGKPDEWISILYTESAPEPEQGIIAKEPTSDNVVVITTIDDQAAVSAVDLDISNASSAKKSEKKMKKKKDKKGRIFKSYFFFVYISTYHLKVVIGQWKDLGHWTWRRENMNFSNLVSSSKKFYRKTPPKKFHSADGNVALRVIHCSTLCLSVWVSKHKISGKSWSQCPCSRKGMI